MPEETDNQIQEEQIEETTAEETTTEEVTETTQGEQEAFLEVKYNKEQIKLDKEKAAEYAQKGMNYDKAVERARQEGVDQYVANQGYEWDGKKITTETEYKQALKEQELIDNYKQKDLPDEVIKELVESQKFREKYNEQQKTTEQQTKQQDDYKQFIESFPDAKAEDIPASVWEQVDKGKSLVDAYTHHENKTLKEQIKSLSEKKEIEQTNEENAASSTGSVTGQGTAKAARFTRDQVDKMSREDVDRNWSAIQKSMKNWE